jgi:ABC-2 type transport system permease protein
MNATIVRLTLRSLLGRARFWLLVPLPLILVALSVIGHLRHPDGSDWLPAIGQALGFGVVIPLMSLIIGTAVVGSEIDDGTIVHILTKPLPRRVIIFSKLFVAALVTAVVTGVTMYIVGAIAIDSRVGLGLAVGAVVASVAYSALFVALSVVTRRPVLLGLVYILLWEGLLAHLLPKGGSVSIEAYAVEIARRVGDTTVIDGKVGLVTAIVMSVVFLVAGAALATDRLKAFTLAGDTS